jgi:hypothetical protein
MTIIAEIPHGCILKVDHRLNDTQKHARNILSFYFMLIRVETSDRSPNRSYPPDLLRNLLRTISDGVHNLPEIVAGRWVSYALVNEKTLKYGLESQMFWLYDKLENLGYPDEWTNQCNYPGDVWRTFCNHVAAAIKKPPRYGQPVRPEVSKQLCSEQNCPCCG